MNDDLYKEMASQLSCPQGEKAVSYGDEMYRAHKYLIESTIDLMNIKSKSEILEIGFGAAKHLDYIFDKAPYIRYSGLEISPEMIDYSWQLIQNADWKSQVNLSLYDGNIIPFADNRFDSVISINSLYFWKDIRLVLQEIRRVLNSKGSLLLGTINDETLRKAPFTKYSFNYYSKQDIMSLLTDAGFDNVKVHTLYDKLIGVGGNEISRTLDIYTSEKSASM